MEKTIRYSFFWKSAGLFTIWFALFPNWVFHFVPAFSFWSFGIVKYFDKNGLVIDIGFWPFFRFISFNRVDRIK
jgi:hypothetical protein